MIVIGIVTWYANTLSICSKFILAHEIKISCYWLLKLPIIMHTIRNKSKHIKIKEYITSGQNGFILILLFCTLISTYILYRCVFITNDGNPMDSNS